MNIDSELVFIVGPGSSGKSTTGKILADNLGYGFIDIDFVFCARHILIPDFVKQYGYKAYSEANSKLFETLVTEYPRRMVMPLSSGFLVHEDSPELIARHRQRIKELGVSILLLPHPTLEVSTEIIVQRQLARFEDVKEETERQRLTSRFPRYLDTGDIQVFSHEPAPVIAAKMASELAKLDLPRKLTEL